MGRLAKELRQAKQDMKDLSDRKGAYANVPKYRLYKYQEDVKSTVISSLP